MNKTITSPTKIRLVRLTICSNYYSGVRLNLDLNLVKINKFKPVISTYSPKHSKKKQTKNCVKTSLTLSKLKKKQ